MWELDCEESRVPKNWCFWITVLEKTLESPLDCKEIQPVHSKWDQPWDFFGRNDAKAETPVLWPPHVKSWLIGKDSDAESDWGQEEKEMAKDEMAGWHQWLDGRESEWTPGVGDGQGGLVCCDSWGLKESDTTKWLNWTESEFSSLQSKVRTFISLILFKGFHMAVVVKNPPANAGDARDACLSPLFGRSPGIGNSNPLQYSCLGNPRTEKSGRLESTGLQKESDTTEWLSTYYSKLILKGLKCICFSEVHVLNIVKEHIYPLSNIWEYTMFFKCWSFSSEACSSCLLKHLVFDSVIFLGSWKCWDNITSSVAFSQKCRS